MGRTVILTSSFPLFEGDFRGNFVFNYARKCSGQVVVIAPHAPNIPFKEVVQGITIYRLPYHLKEDLFYRSGIPEMLQKKPLKTLKSIPFLGVLTTFLLTYLKKDDLLISHWLFPTALLGATITAIKGNKHHVVVHSGGITLMKQYQLRRIARWINRYTDQFQFVNQVHQQWFESLLRQDIREKVLLKPMPVSVGVRGDDEHFFPDRVMYIGRLEPIKGVAGMLKDIASTSIRPTIAGDGVLKRDLERHFPRANFIGPVYGAEKEALYRDHSIQIVPSLREGIRMEGFPTVILEGLHYGNLLLVSQKIEGIKYLLRDHREICFYNPEISGELPSLLDKISQNTEYYRKIVHRGQQQIKTLIL